MGSSTLEENVVVLPDLFLDEAVLSLGLHARQGLHLQPPPESKSSYFYLCSSGSGGFEEDLSDGAESMSSSSVADLKLLFWSALRLKGRMWFS